MCGDDPFSLEVGLAGADDGDADSADIVRVTGCTADFERITRIYYNLKPSSDKVL